MFYISVKDIMSVDIATLGASDNEATEITREMIGGGIEAVALYLDNKNRSLRDSILGSLGMDITQRVVTETNVHRLLNGNSTETYEGTRWVGRTVDGQTEHEVHQDLMSEEKYQGIGEELGIRIKADTKKQFEDNPKEILTVQKFEEKHDDT